MPLATGNRRMFSGGGGGGARWRLVIILAGVTGADLMAAAAACALLVLLVDVGGMSTVEIAPRFLPQLFKYFLHNENIWSMMREERAEG